jgi:spore coat polysaccharide biosynthesis protein SpsF
MTVLILQARLDSSRLPGKALLPLGGRPMVLRVMEALSRFPCDRRVLACPQDSETAFAPLAEEAGFSLFVGSKEDVLDRFRGAAQRFDARWIVRATGDNPFVFPDAAAALMEETEKEEADYGAYGATPYGAGVEVIRSEALYTAAREAREPFEREHVCPYLYGHPERFLLHRPLAPKRWRGPQLRITVDTQRDYERAQGLYEALEGEQRFRGQDIIRVYKRFFSTEEQKP